MEIFRGLGIKFKASVWLLIEIINLWTFYERVEIEQFLEHKKELRYGHLLETRWGMK